MGGKIDLQLKLLQISRALHSQFSWPLLLAPDPREDQAAGCFLWGVRSPLPSTARALWAAQ